ncbi:hypothetical protein Fcan01_27385 [Folsomia candida]|uniref:Uncharacterized protein n=1 Tax=Folsomia candida TaxID=158441 RepID=A0A226CYI7_FOLCA|nr:hypothetical protein Fcan01_27385 [Folsomia candida]
MMSHATTDTCHFFVTVTTSSSQVTMTQYPSSNSSCPTTLGVYVQNFQSLCLSVQKLLFDGVQCYQSSEKCYDLDATLFMIEALFPSETKPCESLQMLSIFSGVHDEVWQNDEDIMRLLPPPMGHLEVEKNHLCQALPSTIARFKGKILSRFPNLVTECENYIASI